MCLNKSEALHYKHDNREHSSKVVAPMHCNLASEIPSTRSISKSCYIMFQAFPHSHHEPFLAILAAVPSRLTLSPCKRGLEQVCLGSKWFYFSIFFLHPSSNVNGKGGWDCNMETGIYWTSTKHQHTKHNSSTPKCFERNALIQALELHSWG